MARRGRPAVFRDKVPASKRVVWAMLSPKGWELFEAVRARLATIYRKETGRSLDVSDGDALEYALRGDRDAAASIRQQLKD